MPKTKNTLNELGLWLNDELNRRGILLASFAKEAGIAPQYLSVLTRGDGCMKETREIWRTKFQEALDRLPMDGDRR